MPKLLSTVSSLCQSGGLYTSTAGVSISTRVDIDESLQKINFYNIHLEEHFTSRQKVSAKKVKAETSTRALALTDEIFLFFRKLIREY